MRCLGRLISLIVLAGVIFAAWFFRDDLRRMIDHQVHPAVAAQRVGRPAPAALARAKVALARMQNGRADSVVLDADEAASLLAAGVSFLPGPSRDSLTVELEDGGVRIRTVIDSALVPGTLRSLIPGHPQRYHEVSARGALTPVHAGLAELVVDHVALHAVPLPVDLVTRIAATISGRPIGSRVEVVLPEMVGGFRVRPGGVTIYRSGGAQ